MGLHTLLSLICGVEHVSRKCTQPCRHHLVMTVSGFGTTSSSGASGLLLSIIVLDCPCECHLLCLVSLPC